MSPKWLIPMVFAVMACSDHDRCGPPRVTLQCKPCNGHGNVIAINTVEPVPIGVIKNYALCFSEQHADTCWHDCPDGIVNGDKTCEH